MTKKSLKDFIEGYRPKGEGEQKFVDKHVIIKHADRNGNGDDVFNAKNIKTVKRSTEHGYDPGQDEKVYEEVEDLDEIRKPHPLLKGAQKNLADLKKGIKKPTVRPLTWKQSLKQMDNERKAKFKEHKKSYEYHKQELKNLNDAEHDLKSGNLGIHKNDKEGQHGAAEEIESMRSHHTSKMNHHLQKMHYHNDLLDKPYQIKEELDESIIIKSVGNEKVAIQKNGKTVKTFSGPDAPTKARLHLAKMHEEVEKLDEISHETRKNWVHKTFQNHLRHYDYETKSVVPPKKPGEMPKARQKIFDIASAKMNAEFMRKHKEDQRKKLESRTPKVHDLRHMSHGEVYDHTQTHDHIHDGDVLHVKGGVAAMVGAWPTMIHGKSKDLHHFKDGTTIHNIDGGMYHKTGKVADKLHKGLKEEVEPIQELSKKLLDRYMSKSHLADRSRWVGAKGRKTSEMGILASDKNNRNSRVHATESVDNTKLPMFSTIKHHIDLGKGMGGKAKWGDHMYIDEHGRSIIVSDDGRHGTGDTEGMGVGAEVASFHGRPVTHDPKTGKKLTKESVEQIDELSKDTIVRYTRKAKDDLESNAEDRGHFSRGDSEHEKNKYRYFRKQQRKRSKGLDRAITRLAKEDVVDRFIQNYIPEDRQELTVEDRFNEKIADYSSSYQSLLSGLFASLDEENQKFMVELLDDESNINELIDFALTNEEVEQIDELSKDTLRSYAVKANRRGHMAARMSNNGTKKDMSDYANKRRIGVEKAINKLTNEEVEQIDELSKKTLGSYITKAHSSANSVVKRMSKLEKFAKDIGSNPRKTMEGGKNGRTYKDMDREVRNRDKGIHTATKKLTKEETE